MFKVLISVVLLANLAYTNANLLHPAPLNDKPTCSVCTIVLTAAQNLLEQNKTEAQVLGFIEKELCARLGALNGTCVQYVEAYGAVILHELGQKLDPSVICSHLGLCQTQPVKPHAVLKSISNPLDCTLCKTVFTQVKNLLTTNATEAQIISYIDTNLCNATGQYSLFCKTIVDTFGPQILKYLSNGIDPEKVCELLGLCQKSVPKVELKQNPIYCTVCEYAVQFLDSELKHNKTEAAVVAALDQVCKIVPSSLKDQCNSLINTYGTYLVQLLIQFADPLKVCQAIKLC